MSSPCIVVTPLAGVMRVGYASILDAAPPCDILNTFRLFLTDAKEYHTMTTTRTPHMTDTETTLEFPHFHVVIRHVGLSLALLRFGN